MSAPARGRAPGRDATHNGPVTSDDAVRADDARRADDLRQRDTPAAVRADAWVERTDGWHRVPSPQGLLDVAALPRDVRTTWVVTAELEGLVQVARALAADQDAGALLDRHTRHAARASHSRARVDRGADGRVVLTSPTVSFVPATGDVHTGWVTAVVCPGVVVTSEQGDAGVLAAAAARLEDDLPDPDEGAHAVLATVLLTIAQQAGDVEAEIGDAVARVERHVFSPDPQDDVLSQVYDLKREIVEARRALAPVGAALPDLVDGWDGASGRHGAPAWLRRVQSAVDRIDRHLDGHDALLGDMLSVHLARVSVRQNEDMRKISAWAAMITVPTLVAGIYGMNFRHMPELGWTFGYPLALVAMGGICVVLWRAFRRSGWL